MGRLLLLATTASLALIITAILGSHLILLIIVIALCVKSVKYPISVYHSVLMKLWMGTVILVQVIVNALMGFITQEQLMISHVRVRIR